MINFPSAAILIAFHGLWSGIFAVSAVEFKFDPIVLNKHEIDAIHAITPSEWLDCIKIGSLSYNLENGLETNLLAAEIVVKNGTISHVQLLDTLPSPEALEDSELADEILRSTLYVYNTKCAPRGISGEHCAAMLSDIELPQGSELAQKCQNVIKNRKNGDYALRRLLPRHYADGFYRMFSNKPEPLTISQAIGANAGNDKKQFLDVSDRNLAVVQWSQFVAHDLNKPVVTTMSNGSPIECCSIENYNLAPRHKHPACEPLIYNDVKDRYARETCLNYVRSALAVDNKCTFAPPEQLNQATAKLDLSPLYGFNEKSQKRMRSYRMGQLKSTNFGSSQDSLLPLTGDDTNWFCALDVGEATNSTCFMAGDSRVNSNPFAIILYTIMMRNHNLIAKELSVKHTDWQDEKIFHTAKSINIEIYKQIVLNEWLPVVLGTSMAKDVQNVGKNNADAESQHQISNEYAVAASRFYLSMMPNELHNYANSIGTDNHKELSSDKSIFILKDEIYSPSIEYSSKKLDHILYSLLMQKAMKMDASYVESLTTDLTGSKRPSHSDLLAFDIQRGRDHGLQPYYKYLEVCNNIKVNDWKDFERFIMKEDLNKLKSAYSNWRDIDLIVGGISETAAKTATVGPTFQCIIAEQFSKLRQWDQSEIEQTDLDFSKWKTLAAVDLFCLNSNLQQLPMNIFKIPSATNPMVNCSERLNKFKF